MNLDHVCKDCGIKIPSGVRCEACEIAKERIFQDAATRGGRS